MSLNKFYDIIVEQHSNYEQYNKFLQTKQAELAEKRKENAKEIKDLILSGETPEENVLEELSNKVYEYQAEEVLYKQDCQTLYYNLYINVKTYMQLEGGMILPDEIVNVCKAFEHTLPKPYFVIEKEGESLVAKEIEVGRVEKQKEFFKSVDVKNIQQSIINALTLELDKNKQ